MPEKRRKRKRFPNLEVRLVMCGDDPLMVSKMYTAMVAAMMEVGKDLPEEVHPQVKKKGCGCSGG